MTKSHDDPDAADLERVELDRVDRARLARERAARRSRPAFEDSFPPPPTDLSWPPEPVSGVGTPSATIDPFARARHGGRWIVWLAGILAALGTIYTTTKPIIGWFASRASTDDVTKTKTACEATAVASASAAVLPLMQRIGEIEKKQKRDGQRWDALDKWHVKSFQRTNQTKVPQFGPKAESRGAAALPEDIDEP